MALLQITEPGESTAPHQHRLAAGIDLGTTNSLVASVRSGMAETLADADGAHLLPSVVHYSADDKAVVGQAALTFAETDPLNTIASVKRLMGRGVDDIKQAGGYLPYAFVPGSSGMPLLHTAAGDISPVEVSAEILRTLRIRAEQSLGGELQGVVVTVPAYFDDAQRQATKDAARGTFDISILRLNKGVFEVLSTAGDTALGGDDMDRLVANWLMQQAGIDAAAGHGRQRHVLQLARAAKEALTVAETTNITVSLDDGSSWTGSLSRDEFNRLITPLVDKTLGPCRRALRDAGLRVAGVQSVVLVGGSTRVPLVRERIAEFFSTQPQVDLDPDKVVAIGAAIQADILAGNKPDDDMLLLDVIPLSLGLETKR